MTDLLWYHQRVAAFLSETGSFGRCSNAVIGRFGIWLDCIYHLGESLSGHENNCTECCSNVVLGLIGRTTGLLFIDSGTEELRPAEITRLRLSC
jgi:hypothetical protein